MYAPFLYSQGSTDGPSHNQSVKNFLIKWEFSLKIVKMIKLKLIFKITRLKDDSLIDGFFDERSRIRQKLWLEGIFRINIIRWKFWINVKNREKNETWNSETLKKGVCYSGIRNSLKLSKRVSQITSLYSKWAHWITAHWVFEYWIKIQHSMLPPDGI